MEECPAETGDNNDWMTAQKELSLSTVIIFIYSLRGYFIDICDELFIGCRLDSFIPSFIKYVLSGRSTQDMVTFAPEQFNT